MSWQHLLELGPKTYTCGHCSKLVGAAKGYFCPGASPQIIFICPNCNRPSYFHANEQIPGVIPGTDVAHLPQDIEKLYREARSAVSIGAHTAAVLSCRKLLMHIAVAQGAPTDQTFIAYVEHLAKNGYVPPNGRGWVDHIRTKGNEANHEIQLMSKADAEELISFAEMLMKFIYEFPQRVPKT